MGRVKHPGPGFLPFGLGLCLIILSLILISNSWKRDHFSYPLLAPKELAQTPFRCFYLHLLCIGHRKIGISSHHLFLSPHLDEVDSNGFAGEP